MWRRKLNYILLDSEFNTHNRHEIIQLSAIKIVLNEKKIKTDSFFNQYVQPKIGKKLTPFIKSKTKIKQSDIDKAKSFDKIIAKFRDWIGIDYRLIGWSNADCQQIKRDCNLYKLNHNWANKYINLQRNYTDMIIKNLEIENRFKHLICFKNDLGLDSALKYEGIKFSGKRHNALCDTINMTKLFYKHLNRWGFIKKGVSLI